MTKLIHHGQGQLVLQILVVEVALHGQVQSLRHLHPLVVDQHCLVSDLDTLDTPDAIILFMVQIEMNVISDLVDEALLMLHLKPIRDLMTSITCCSWSTPPEAGG